MRAPKRRLSDIACHQMITDARRTESLNGTAEAEDRTVKYVLLMYADPAHTQALTAGDRDMVARKHAALRAELTSSGELLDGAGLAYPADTTTLRLQDGAAATSHGPLMTSTVQLTAYYLVRCPDADRAHAIAAHILDSHVTAVEVRPVHDSAHPG